MFFLAAASIWCLLAEFYGLCSRRVFTLYILIPATIVLIAIAVLDYVRGDGRLWRAVVIGSIAGFLAACAYDIFRLPFVIAAADHTGPAWLRLPLFRVFPRFGAMILGEPFTANGPDSQFTLMAHVIGWIYHFSNGITFGVMYMALAGNAVRRQWGWAILLAVGLELAMLYTPYTNFFGIGRTTRFVAVTLTAHLIFGVALGLCQGEDCELAGPIDEQLQHGGCMKLSTAVLYNTRSPRLTAIVLRLFAVFLIGLVGCHRKPLPARVQSFSIPASTNHTCGHWSINSRMKPAYRSHSSPMPRLAKVSVSLKSSERRRTIPRPMSGGATSVFSRSIWRTRECWRRTILLRPQTFL